MALHRFRNSTVIGTDRCPQGRASLKAERVDLCHCGKARHHGGLQGPSKVCGLSGSPRGPSIRGRRPVRRVLWPGQGHLTGQERV